ncbi:MAG TPA: adhesin [Elusimicrobia bacterium]|nr:adhesin [Elusimicrobiota bacterium]
MSFTVYNPVGISSVTVDNRTGLMWVTNPKTDAGFYGTQNWESALTSCTVTLNGMAYGGYTDWRLPNARELSSIVDYGAAAAPLINTTAFPGTVSNDYWASTTLVRSPISAWTVDFSEGNLTYDTKTKYYYVRCVRGGP